VNERDDIDEPLFVSAPIAYAAARTLCDGGGVGKTSCAWYHGSWQYFRALGIVTAPTVHTRGLVAALREIAGRGAHPRVLISGAADYSLLAHVLHTYRSERARIEPTVVDRCETPCYLSRWYADYVAASLSTQASDILDHRADTPYDVICTHGFFGNFDSAGRRALIERWHGLLRPGGRVVTVQRVRPGYEREHVAFSNEEATAFRAAVFERATEMAEHLDVSAQQLAALASAYAERVCSHPVRSDDELREAFEERGFELQRFERVVTLPRAGARVSGPALPAGAEHVEIVAVRR